MAKKSRNAPCPCGSGKRYKKCCLLHTEVLEQINNMWQNLEKAFVEIDEIDDLSNSVIPLIKSGKLDEAEAVCNDLIKRYPEQVDGIDRLASVYEARGENEKAIEYYLKTVEFMRTNPGFDEEGIEWTLDKVKRLKNKL